MNIRTDLALEEREINQSKNPTGFESHDSQIGSVKVNHIKIINKEGEKSLLKPAGDYITIEFSSLTTITDYSEIKEAVIKSLKELLPDIKDNFLVVGLGNSDITPDALGPLTIKSLIATRHIDDVLASEIGLNGLHSVAAITPGVLGKTGIEAAEIILGTVKRINPSAVIVIDALAARTVSRICNTIQLCNTGISPGSGVNNSRKEINQKTLNVPVIAIGVPTVVDIGTLIYEITGESSDKINKNMIVTPQEIDLLIDRASEILSKSLNIFLQPEIEEDIILSLL